MAAATQLPLVGGAPASDGPGVDVGATFGEIFTRRWVVEFILDQVGYTQDADLGAARLVEPSCGAGAFLIPVVERLVMSARRHGKPLSSLNGAIRAFDLLEANTKLARKAVAVVLQDGGLDSTVADELAAKWITTGDFLLRDHEIGAADFVVGNPPYVRLEDVPAARMAAYRSVSSAMRGRADLYVGFIEVGLSLLARGGVLGFICADRWMRNQYGADLREIISRFYAVNTVVSMHAVDAFEDDVSAYPAVVVLQHGPQGETNLVEARASFDRAAAEEVDAWSRQPDGSELSAPSFDASRLPHWFQGRGLWPTGNPRELSVIADLEARFPPLEDVRTGTRVGIGVATGCDDVYLVRDPDLVEPDRLLPLLQATDTARGEAEWSGTFLVNPWGDNGLVDLGAYPKLRDYLTRHGDRLRERHVAKKRPYAWYRTIDRVHAGIQHRGKLVLPDLKAAAHPVLDDGRYYPHHNLYYVVSEAWDLEVLGGLLLSDVANLFVGAYCVRMRGGYYRFQAQYLRRIRVPDIAAISSRQSSALADAFRRRDVRAATSVAAELYELPLSMRGLSRRRGAVT